MMEKVNKKNNLIMVIKAVRAVMQLGDMELDVFRLPDGEYGFSSTGIANILGLSSHRRVGQILTSERLKRKTSIALGLGKNEDFKLSFKKISSDNAGNINFIPLNLVYLLIQYESHVNQNPIADSLAGACISESLERRADNAFGVLRTEQERNERFVTRRDSILSRTFWTDVIEDYMKNHEVSDNYRRFIYNNVSDYLNRSLFGKSSKEIREHYNIGNYSPRDYFPSQTLKLVDTIEKATGVRVKNNNVDPKQALKDVVSMLGIEPDENRL
jgi:hypothetical protein